MRFLCPCTALLLSLPKILTPTDAFSGQPQSSKSPMKVLVTGAAGKTGRIVLSKLERDHRYEPKGMFRNVRSARSIVRNDDTRCPLEHVVIADVTSPTFVDDLSERTSDDADDNGASTDASDGELETSNSDSNNENGNSNGLENMEAMIICTSAVARIRKRSLATMLVKLPWRALRGEPLMDIHSMRFAWKHGGYPEKVDYHGQIAQIDLAKRLGIPHVILVSSMGGTNPDNFINSVGKIRRTSKPKQEGHGDILVWKRRAERYLVESGLDYTILHPGALIDAHGVQEDFVLGVNDELYELNHHSTNGSASDKKGSVITKISREDVAELCVAALSAGKGKKTSFDCITLSTSTISSFLPLSMKPTTDSESEKKINIVGRIRTRIDTSISSTASSSTATSASTVASATTIPVTSATTAVSRHSAEEALNDFLDLNIATDYNLIK